MWPSAVTERACTRSRGRTEQPSTPIVDVIDTQTNVLSTSIALGTTNGDSKMAVSPDGSHAYVISDSGLVWVIDTMKNAVLTSVTISEGNPLLG